MISILRTINSNLKYIVESIFLFACFYFYTRRNPVYFQLVGLFFPLIVLLFLHSSLYLPFIHKIYYSKRIILFRSISVFDYGSDML